MRNKIYRYPRKEKPVNNYAKGIAEDLQQANKSLRQKAIIVGIIMIVTLSFYKIHIDNTELSQDCYEAISILEKMRDNSDLKKYMEIQGYFPFIMEKQEVYHLIVDDSLIENLKQSNYCDISSINKRLSELVNKRKELKELQSNISILGLNLPFKGVLIALPLLFLFLFHDLTQMVYFKKRLEEKFEQTGMEGYKQGPDFLSFLRNEEDNDTVRFFRAVSNLVIGFFLIASLLTCIMFQIDLSNNYLRSGDTIFFETFGVVCLILIAIDIFIILFIENILGFKFFVLSVIDFNYLNIFSIIIRWCILYIFPFFSIEFHILQWFFTRVEPPIHESIIFITYQSLFTLLFPVSVWACWKYPGKNGLLALRILGSIIYFLNLLGTIDLFRSNSDGYKNVDINHQITSMGTIILVLSIIPALYLLFVKRNFSSVK
jgi:hypothetical protein